MKNLFFLVSGVLLGSWISWPGIFNLENWECFNEIVENSRNEKISIKAILEVSPKYFFKGVPDSKLSQFRIVSDACFR